MILMIKVTKIINSLEIIPIENNVLPIQLGKAYITKKNLQLIYHIDLNKIENVILAYQKEIDKFKKEPLGFSQTANYRYLQESNKINIESFEEIVNEKIRTKRGLINLGGKISKILFGTLDSDDEELYRNYFNSIKKNEETLIRNQKKIATVVNDLKNKYIDKFQKMHDNLELLKIVPALEEVQQMHLMTFELKDIKNTLDEIQTAISFARLHLLHESILPYSKFSEVIKNSSIIPLHHIKDYYQLCHTKVIFKNKILLFLISIPTIYEKGYELYKFYFLSQNNESLSLTDSYMLSQEEELLWSTSQCHPVEEDFLCDQDLLSKPPECIRNLLKNHKENCSRIVSVPQANLKLLEDGNILSIKNEKVQEKCPQQTKHYFIPPTAILRSRCVVGNTQKEIFPISTIMEEKYIVLPKMAHPMKNQPSSNFKKEDIPDIQLEDLEEWHIQPGYSLIFILMFIIILILIFFLIFKYLKNNRLAKVTPIKGDNFNLGGEELQDSIPF